MNFLFRYANPHEFMRLSGKLLPFFAVAAALCVAIGLYLSFSVPPDYQQGTTVTLMFIHVPADVVAELAYCAIAVCSFLSLVWRHPLSDIAARAAAPFGALFTVLGLITGSLWGKPMWGTFWAWDPRLTSELILLFLFFGVMSLRAAFEDANKGDRAASLLALVGVVNVPIIHFSVVWWNSLHQGATVAKFGKPSMDLSMLWPLLAMFLGFMLFFFGVLC